MQSTVKELILNDGRKVELTLTFALLYKLRGKRKKDYEKYSEIVMNGVDEMLDYPRALYAAYLCGCIKNEIDEQLTEEEFYELLPFDMGEVVNTYLELYNSGKKNPSGNPSA